MSKTKIAYLCNVPNDLLPLTKLAKGFSEGDGEEFELCLRLTEDLRSPEKLEGFLAFAVEAPLVIVNLMGGKGSFPEIDRIAAALGGTEALLHAQPTALEQDIDLLALSTVSQEQYRQISRYINYGGLANLNNLLLYAANCFAGGAYEVGEPLQPPWEGLYHPDLQTLLTLEEYLARYPVSGRPTLGICFYHSFWQSDNTGFVDALVREIEAQGAKVIPVFLNTYTDTDLGARGVGWAIENFFMKDGEPIIDALISLLAFSLTLRPGSPDETLTGAALRKLNVPLLKAFTTYRTREEWQESDQGLSSMEITSSVAMPEFDGFLITLPVAARQAEEIDELTGARIVKYVPLEERLPKLVRLALNWAKLRYIPKDQKRIAIIFHNYPPRNDNIGSAFGLDAPESVWRLLGKLQEAGYVGQNVPESSQALMDEFLQGCTNDRRWVSSDELARRAVGRVSREEYGQWFSELPVAVRERMQAAWGDPPGRVFSHQGALLIPGKIFGNIFLGVQPPRGFLEDPSTIYHSPDLPLPHHYYAYYRWVRDSFGAQVILHIGKHGTLEWLPGKSVGLSEACFPDIAISDLPNLYPYIINNPGEGTTAKRRSYACLIDHLIPVMHNADTYDDLAEIKVLIEEYNRALQEDPAKLPHLQPMIWEKVEQTKLDHDLEIDSEGAFADFEGFLERLHAYLHEIGDTQIRDGLHIFGEPPGDSRLEEFLVALTRLANGDVPSLRQSLAESRGYDYEALIAEPGKRLPSGLTGAQIIEETQELSLLLMQELRARAFDARQITAAAISLLGEAPASVVRVLHYLCTSLVPRIERTIDEVTNTLGGIEGRAVPPGPSGAPTRGMADILPTGRNFYSGDPQTIPSPAAWRVGVALGEALLARYLEEEGCYPENLGIIVWGTSTMRTRGDDIAEVLYLMGVRPKWEPSTGRVKGLEVIPSQELGRPRIDVTLRITGMFRDSFPNLVNLLDRAVEMVATLKEPEGQNFLARHVEEETQAKIAEGIDPELAIQEATYRVFGCKPGTYGAGVSDLIDAKNWKDEKDLGEVYVVWGGYAYGRKQFGAKVPEAFKQRLSQLDVTVKNEDNREYDMLDGDDFYSYHGGMIAAVRAFKGSAPKAYCGDSSDPDHVITRSVAEETKHIFRSRILNPKWIESMKKHGYKGATDFSRMVDFVFGWDATAEVMEDWMYEKLAETYPLDPQMREWLQEVNPYALQNMTERLLEALQREMWQTTEERQRELQRIYLEVEGQIEEGS